MNAQTATPSPATVAAKLLEGAGATPAAAKGLVDAGVTPVGKPAAKQADKPAAKKAKKVLTFPETVTATIGVVGIKTGKNLKLHIARLDTPKGSDPTTYCAKPAKASKALEDKALTVVEDKQVCETCVTKAKAAGWRRNTATITRRVNELLATRKAA